LGGNAKLSRLLRLQLGAGIGSYILLGDNQAEGGGCRLLHFSSRMVFQQPSKIGWALEFVRWNPAEFPVDFSTLRIGVLF